MPEPNEIVPSPQSRRERRGNAEKNRGRERIRIHAFAAAGAEGTEIAEEKSSKGG
jgi:hypothetical protein